MAVFTIRIETPSKRKPQTRPDDVAERAQIQRALLTIVSAVSNNGSYAGSVTSGTAQAEYSYEEEQTA
jgi:hypothetical protein